MRRVAIVVLVIGALGALFAYGLKPRDDREVASARLGRVMPDFEAPLLPRYVGQYGDSLRLSDFLNKGEPVVVNVWASWCDVCIQEAPVLEAAWERYRGRVTMLGLDFQDKVSDGETFVGRFGVGYPSFSDPKGRIGIDWGVFGVPETYFLRPDGSLLHKHYGGLTPAVMDKQIAELLK